MGLAQELQGFKLWKAAGRSDPILVGFAGEEHLLECSPGLGTGILGGQSLAACPAPSGATGGAFASLPTFQGGGFKGWFSAFQGCRMNVAICVPWRRGGGS